MKIWKEINNEYFSFTSGQRNGLWVLIILLFCLLVAPEFFKHDIVNNQQYIDSVNLAYKNFVDSGKQVNPENPETPAIPLVPFDPNYLDEQGWQGMGLSPKQASSVVNYIQKYGPVLDPEDLKKIYVINDSLYKKIFPLVKITNKINIKEKVNLIDFDPNTASWETLVQVGFTPNQAKAILNYIQKGGKYRDVSDLKKIYGFTESQFSQIAPYVKIVEDSTVRIIKIIKVELNESDSIQLERLPGIGPALAARIINYRHFLGGFVSKEQLLEISGMSSANLSNFLNYIDIDSTKITKLNLNTAELKDLNKHPYLKYDECKAILTYRKLMKQIKHPDELIKNKLISPENYRKLKIYIEL